MKCQEAYFDIVSAVRRSCIVRISAKYLSQCTPTPPLLSQQQSANKFGLQVGINFGLGEGEVHNCSDTDIDASEEGSLRTSFINSFTLTFHNNITVPDPCHVFSVFNSFHSLFSWSVSCLITTSYPSKYGALCNKATLKLISSKFSLYSRFDGPS